MTEGQLQQLLRRTALRMRAAHALSAALAALGIALAAAAGIVCWMRWTGVEFFKTDVVAALPFAAMAFAGAAAFFVHPPGLATAAATLDRRAAVSEHFVTWLYLRGIEDARLNDAQRGFRAAQRQSALSAAETVRLGTHMPIAWPPWSRSIWIATILLLSAILLPASDPRGPATQQRPGGLGITAAKGGGGGSGKDASGALRDTPRVQVLSPAELYKMEMIATDPQLSSTAKADALKELVDAIGEVPESELTPDVRQLLDMLRKDSAAQNPAVKTGGSSVKSGNNENEQHARAGSATPAEYKPFENVEKAWASSEARFEDVRAQLTRYYEKKR